MQLHEQYRPQEWSEVVGQDTAVSKIRRLIDRGLGGRALWISGPSGTGKTTLARLAVAEIASGFNIEELDAGRLTPAYLREIEKTQRTLGLGEKQGRAYIVNEAHGLRKDAVRQLLVLLERIPSHVLWCFTTTNDGEDGFLEGMDDGGPLLSRCVPIALSSQGLRRSFAEHVQVIAECEGLNGQPVERYVRLAKDCRSNMRAMLQSVESGDMCECQNA